MNEKGIPGNEYNSHCRGFHGSPEEARKFAKFFEKNLLKERNNLEVSARLYSFVLKKRSTV
jgi:hypothetical protein